MLAAVITLLRWLTWRPYVPILLPVDVLLLGGVFSMTGALVSKLRSRVAQVRILLALSTSTTVVIWLSALKAAPMTSPQFAAYAVAGAVATSIVVLRSGRPGPRALSFVTTTAVQTAALLVSVVPVVMEAEFALVYALCLPVALTAFALPGIRCLEEPAPMGLVASTATSIAILIACGGWPSGTGTTRTTPKVDVLSRRDRPSLVIIVLDTLRRDHLSLYGYERRTTPNLDAWARDALVFENMTATSSWTVPSHASMFTGLHSVSHGAHGYRGNTEGGNVYVLDSRIATLAEITSGEGLSTGAIIANHFFLGEELGLDQGFDHYWIGRPRRGYEFAISDAIVRRLNPYLPRIYDWPYYRARFITRRAIDWIEDQSGQPYLLFVNYMDTHRPNFRPADDVIPWEDELLLRKHPELWRNLLSGEPLDSQIQRSLINAYDRELRHLDRELAPLLDFLAEPGRLENTFVLITSDHGEFFGEHGLINHMVHPYSEGVDVPLLIKGPGIEPRRSTRQVGSVDVFGTALAVLGLDYRPRQGHNVLEAANRDEVAVSEWYSAADNLLSRPEFGDRFAFDVTTFRQADLRLFEYENGQVELYDLRADPAETVNRAHELPEQVAELQRALQIWRDSHPEASTKRRLHTEMTPEFHEQLKQLGYTE